EFDHLPDDGKYDLQYNSLLTRQDVIPPWSGQSSANVAGDISCSGDGPSRCSLDAQGVFTTLAGGLLSWNIVRVPQRAIHSCAIQPIFNVPFISSHNLGSCTDYLAE